MDVATRRAADSVVLGHGSGASGLFVRYGVLSLQACAEYVSLGAEGMLTCAVYEPSQSYKYQDARKTLTVFAAITLGFLVATIIYSVLCTHNFGHGLRQYCKDACMSHALTLLVNRRKSARLSFERLQPQSPRYEDSLYGSLSPGQSQSFKGKGPVLRMEIE